MVAHTVDISPGRQRRILRQRLGDVVVGAVDIVVFLGSGERERRGQRGFDGTVARVYSIIGSGRRTLVKTLYSQLRMCCWTTMVAGVCGVVAVVTVVTVVRCVGVVVAWPGRACSRLWCLEAQP